MPRYFFHSDVNGLQSDDGEGVVFHCDPDAVAAAQLELADMVRGAIPMGNVFILGVTVVDDSARIVYEGRLNFIGRSPGEQMAIGSDVRAAEFKSD